MCLVRCLKLLHIVVIKRFPVLQLSLFLPLVTLKGNTIIISCAKTYVQNKNFVRRHIFSNFDWQFSTNPLTGSSDFLEVSVIPISIATLPSTVLPFPQDIDFLLSVLIVWRVILWFFLSFLFLKRYSFKDYELAVAFSVSFSFSLLFFCDP